MQIVAGEIVKHRTRFVCQPTAAYLSFAVCFLTLIASISLASANDGDVEAASYTRITITSIDFVTNGVKLTFACPNTVKHLDIFASTNLNEFNWVLAATNKVGSTTNTSSWVDTSGNGRRFYVVCDAVQDTDADGLPDAMEKYIYRTSLTNADSDKDGFSDKVELDIGTDPNSASSHPANISGTVSYSGGQTGSIRVVAVTVSNSWATNFSATLTNSGPYSITNIPNQVSYWVKAWRDSNGNRSNDTAEAWGAYPGNPVSLTNSTNSINITLSDPDSDCDGLPDWVETGTGIYVSPWNTGTSPTNRDSDGDGISDGMDSYPTIAGPTITILSPAQNSTVTTSSVVITGKISSSNSLNSVTVYGSNARLIPSFPLCIGAFNFTFSNQLSLADGQHSIDIDVLAVNGLQSEKWLYVNVDTSGSTGANPTNNPGTQDAIQWEFIQQSQGSGGLQQIGTERQVTIRGKFSDPSSADAQVSNVWVILECSNKVDETRREYYNVPVTGDVGTERKFEVADVNLCGTNSAVIWLAAQNKWSNIGITTFSGRADVLKFSLSWTATWNKDGTIYYPGSAGLTVIGPTPDIVKSVSAVSSTAFGNHADWELRGDDIKAGVYQVYAYYDNQTSDYQQSGNQSTCEVTLDGSSLVSVGPRDIATHNNDQLNYVPWTIATVVIHKDNGVGGYEVREYARDEATGNDEWNIRDMIPAQGYVVANNGVVPLSAPNNNDDAPFQVAANDFNGPNGGNPVYLRVGESAQFSAVGCVNVNGGNPDDAEKRGILGQFSVCDTNGAPTDIAYIDTLGVFTGLKPGHVQVTCGTCFQNISPAGSWSFASTNGTNISVYILSGDLVPDWNHDRVIDESDREAIHHHQPFRFWIDDASENGDVATGNEAPQPSSSADCNKGQVCGRYDLENFFPVWLDISNLVSLLPPTDSNVQYILKQEDSAVNMVYTELTTNTAGTYLTEDVPNE